ncbi:MAG: hypothetical protein ACJA1P_002111, partial [Maribacter sp.]
MAKRSHLDSDAFNQVILGLLISIRWNNLTDSHFKK